jgi:uncharacterized protein with FMN-binding domain
MRRAVPAVIATVGGLALLANFHTGSTKPGALAALTSSTTSTTVAGASPPPTDTPATRATSPKRTATTTTPAPSATRHVDGSVVGTQYGDVEVAVTVANGRITDVQAVELPFDHSRSAEISDQVAPMLRDEALQAQSAQIDLISGATYTSDAYVQSLQSALDQLRS